MLDVTELHSNGRESVIEFAQVLSALAAILAVAAALWTAMESRRLRRLEVSRDEQARDDAARAQAVRVSAWCVTCPDHPVEEDEEQNGIIIRNVSALPLYELVVWSNTSLGAPRHAAEMKVVPPGAFVLLAKMGFHWAFPRSASSVRGEVRPITRSAEWIVTRMEFTDAHGQRWCREGAELTRIADDPSSTTPRSAPQRFARLLPRTSDEGSRQTAASRS